MQQPGGLQGRPAARYLVVVGLVRLEEASQAHWRGRLQRVEIIGEHAAHVAQPDQARWRIAIVVVHRGFEPAPRSAHSQAS
jgi:hypothetical protein